MPTLISSVSGFLSFLTLAAQVLILLFFGLAAFGGGSVRAALFRFVGKHTLPIAFLVSFAATAGSLFYSQIAGYTPCTLCWFQRIFIYPQVILFAVALWKNDRGIIDYALALSIVGAIIAAYHYLLQLGVAPALPCSAVGVSVSCSQRFVLAFGYITIPMMALSAFALIASVLLAGKYARRFEREPNTAGIPLPR